MVRHDIKVIHNFHKNLVLDFKDYFVSCARSFKETCVEYQCK